MEDDLTKLLNEIGYEITNKMQNILLHAPSFPGKDGKIYRGRRATGNLVNSIEYEVTPDHELIIKYSDYGELSKNKRTGAVSGNMDQGRRKGKYVPINPLLDWMKVKRIKWKEGGSSKDVLSKNKKKALSGEQKNLRMAFAISHSIKNKGIKATDFTAPLALIRTSKKPQIKQSVINYLVTVFGRKK